MGVSRITALEIQGNETLVEARKSEINGLYEGWLYMLRDGEIHKPMLNTAPVHETQGEAIASMDAIVEAVRGMSLH